MPPARRSVARRRPMARRLGPPAAELDARAGMSSDGGGAAAAARSRGLRRWSSPARIGMASIVAVLAGITIIGALSPSPVAGGAGSSPAASAIGDSTTASAVAGSAWGAAVGIDPIDLITKGALVLVLLFITLRVLGRMQAAGPRRGGRLSVLESRTLASKASLHLVAVGDRRLVVGLTPNGMVALAEMDAAELEDALTAESPAGEPEAGPAGGPLTAAARHSGAALASGQAPFAATLNALLAPIDNLTDRVAGFFNGSRAG